MLSIQLEQACASKNKEFVTISKWRKLPEFFAIISYSSHFTSQFCGFAQQEAPPNNQENTNMQVQLLKTRISPQAFLNAFDNAYAVLF